MGPERGYALSEDLYPAFEIHCDGRVPVLCRTVTRVSLVLLLGVTRVSLVLLLLRGLRRLSCSTDLLLLSR